MSAGSLTTHIASLNFTCTELLLLEGQTYYVSFKARNAAGLWSPAGMSSGVVNGSPLKKIYLPSIAR